MLMPSIFGENLFDDWKDDWKEFAFPDIDKALYGKHAKHMMKTDVKETEQGYEVAVDLPGFKKEEIKLELNHGYLTINVAKGLNKEDKNDKYIRRERYSGSMSRSFYVGENVKESDIHAKYEDGILTLEFPKEDKKALGNHYIAIEG